MNLIEEATKILNEAENRNIIVRVMGAIAFRLHSPNFSWIHEKFNREISDVDFVTYSKYSAEVTKLLEEFGYRMERALAVYETKRRIFYPNNRKYVVDVFLDELNMCHKINFKHRLEVDYPTIPLAELLLEKLQIIEFTKKDFIDVIMLLREHEVANNDSEAINREVITNLLSDDWGFYYTATNNLKKLKGFLVEHCDISGVLSDSDIKNIDEKIGFILKAIDEAPKTMKWKMRAKIGDRKKWYQEVESKR
ncbi:MAG: hypothetical protein QXR65_07270 [Candidatus Bathyarchaeia archaeon]|nr:hypothetical protein [Candidatus Bathyarchaeota archaeon]